MKIKIICGFRKDQAFSIDAEEAHKAYYLFFNPEARSSFSDGLAIKGSDIDRIEPDFQGSMGWNATHTLDNDDMNELAERGVARQLRGIMALASDIAKLGKPEDLNLPLSEVAKKYPQLESTARKHTQGMQRIGEIV